MKATLKFDLDDFSDKQNHLLVLKAKDLASALCEISEKLRQIEKYDETKKFTSTEFYEILEQCNLDLGKLYS